MRCFKPFGGSAIYEIGAKMILKIKAFIYRLGDVFGLSIYLADKEEDAYIEENNYSGKGFAEDIARGSWQAKHGFLSVWTGAMPFHVVIWKKIKNVVRF